MFADTTFPCVSSSINRVVGAGCMCGLSDRECPNFLFCRYTLLLTALANALAGALPTAAASLRQNLAAVLSTEPQAGPGIDNKAAWRQLDTATDTWGTGVNHSTGANRQQASYFINRRHGSRQQHRFWPRRWQ